MDTTISGLPKFVAALVRGDGLSVASRAEITKPDLHITTAHLWPLFLADLPVREQRKDLYAGLGVTVFDGPQGRGFDKGGHDGQTANTMVCIEARQRCVLILSNDVRSEAGFGDLVRFILGISLEIILLSCPRPMVLKTGGMHGQRTRSFPPAFTVSHLTSAEAITQYGGGPTGIGKHYNLFQACRRSSTACAFPSASPSGMFERQTIVKCFSG